MFFDFDDFFDDDFDWADAFFLGGFAGSLTEEEDEGKRTERELEKELNTLDDFVDYEIWKLPDDEE